MVTKIMQTIYNFDGNPYLNPVYVPNYLGCVFFMGRIHGTVCPGSSDPLYIASLLYKMGLLPRHTELYAILPSHNPY